MAVAHWFFEPEPASGFVIQEHLRQTFWRAGLSTLWIECHQATPPFRAEGYWEEVALALEWDTADWLLLMLSQDAPRVVQVTQLLLGFKPLARYVQNGRVVYEWRARNRQQRLEELRGNQALENLEALGPAR
ncbi:MAG TPA: hypothetical protein DEP84_20200 [Chloroflexi bacterium]|nr:hypothetical protein [Chloroflexota bacterium]